MMFMKKTIARAAFALLCLLTLHTAAAFDAAAEMLSVTFKEIYLDKDGKWGIRFTLKNNYKDKDIISISELKGGYLYNGQLKNFRMSNESILKKPLSPGKKTSFNLRMKSNLDPRDVSGVTVHSVNHATQASASAPSKEAPAPAKKASAPAKKASAPAKKASAPVKKVSAPAVNHNASIKIRSITKRGNYSTVVYTATVEVLNNSNTQPLVRLDDIVIHYTGTPLHYVTPKRYRQSYPTKTVNIPPLGTKHLKYEFGRDVQDISEVRITATPRFGEARKSDDGTTIIIKK